jgi:hypothetical protein
MALLSLKVLHGLRQALLQGLEHLLTQIQYEPTGRVLFFLREQIHDDVRFLSENDPYLL